MLNIKYDFDDQFIKKHEITERISARASGIYVIYDCNKRPLYVGRADLLRNRLHSHFGGYSNTYRYSYLFKYCSVIYEEDAELREVGEMFLIKKLNTPLNKPLVSDRGIDGKPIDKKISSSEKCQGTTNHGKRCGLRAHANGFCHYHGGNGITMSKIAEEAALKAKLNYKNSRGLKK